MKKSVFIGLLTLAAQGSFAETITCKDNDRSGNGIQIAEHSKATISQDGEVVHTGNVKLSKKPSVGNGDAIYVSTARAEGTFTNGPLPAWELHVSGKGEGMIIAYSEKIGRKLDFITERTLRCKVKL